MISRYLHYWAAIGVLADVFFTGRYYSWFVESAVSESVSYAPGAVYSFEEWWR